MGHNIEFFIVHPEDSVITLYIRKLYDYVNDDTNGHIEFNGYIYYDIGDETKYTRQLTKGLLCMTEYSSEGKEDPDKPGVTTYSFIQRHIWEVEFTKREIIDTTDLHSTIADEDNQPMRVCFFPTDHQRVHFKILREIAENDPIPDEYKTQLTNR